jgi:hypothetical protein
MSVQPLWSDCVATHVTAQLNAKFGELLDTSQALFESQGFSTFDAPEYAMFDTREAAEAALSDMSEKYGKPGVLTGFISNWLNGGGGFAPRDQPLDADYGVGFVVSQGMLDAITHEVGHVTGLLHSDQDLLGTGLLSYDVCGPMSAPVLGDCNCEFNIMEAVQGEGRCPQCKPREASFVTETHGEFFRDVVDCWLTKRRFMGRGIRCILSGIGDCTGYENAPLECLCEDGQTEFELASCQESSQATFDAIRETCGVGPGQPMFEEFCTNYAGYPGVECQLLPDDTTQCGCRSDGSLFTTNSTCEELTAKQIQDACLGQAVTEQCSGSAPNDEIRCVKTADGEFNCICATSGAVLSGSSGSSCADYDLDDLASGCTIPL